MRIFLEFSRDQTGPHRARLRYAFSLFCAIYGHQPILASEQADSADVWISYSPCCSQANLRPVLKLSNLYRPRPPHEPAPPPTKFRLGSEKTIVFYSPPPDQHPDWLGEVFEWVSCADEYSIRARTSVGTIPYAASYVARHKLDVRLPYAAIAMRFLQWGLSTIVPGLSSDPVSPTPTACHFVVSTHDVDFLPVSYRASLGRLAKNAIISLKGYKSAALALQQARKIIFMAVGRANPLDQLPSLVRAQLQRGCNASYFFLTSRRHRRDGNYKIDDAAVIDLMRSLELQGMEIGVHGSYTSLDGPQGLAFEFAQLRQLDFCPQGSRQHWLRFTLDRLIPACERAQALYDTSLGWSECIGFRGGACFAFPPYNFTEERAAGFLEIPLVVMDGNLLKRGGSEEDWYNQATEVLSTSRQYGWGGFSVLWHPTAFGGGQMPYGIAEVFWKLVDHREEWKDSWVSAADFVRSVHKRYVDVGLLSAESPTESITGQHAAHRKQIANRLSHNPLP